MVFYEIREVIKVARRLTYGTVKEIIAGNEIRRQYSELVLTGLMESCARF